MRRYLLLVLIAGCHGDPYASNSCHWRMTKYTLTVTQSGSYTMAPTDSIRVCIAPFQG